MINRFVIFDVETPNFRNNRMSAVGITVVENSSIVLECGYLINPGCSFDDFNINLTGITPEMVWNKPTFSELWPEIEPIMSSGLLVAHNAVFDMGVLGSCLSDYGINWRPYSRYACTCRMSRRVMPEMPNHKLNTLCEHLNIPLDHHNAASDSRACAQLLLCCLNRGANISDYIRTYKFR